MRVLFIDPEISGLYIGRGRTADVFSAEICIKMDHVVGIREWTECEKQHVENRGNLHSDKMADGTRGAPPKGDLLSTFGKYVRSQWTSRGHGSSCPLHHLTRLLDLPRSSNWSRKMLALEPPPCSR